uniref:Uncharacterized protein n=1 Tax=Romanomermis culicivorax TaxID=13658 RepID=A0A915JLU6_ROMCU
MRTEIADDCRGGRHFPGGSGCCDSHGGHGIVLAIETKGTRVGRIATVVHSIMATSPFVQKESQMGGVDGVDYAELFRPETGDPLKNQHGDVRGNG